MLSDPIAALATPPGRSALAMVRLSGSEALRVAAQVIEGFQPDPPRTARLARFLDPSGQAIDRGIYLAYQAPASYTGEPMVEFICHGGATVPAALLAALHAAGARPAAPGEFTRRAVLHGKLDLVQAEAVGDLIDAGAPAQARLALRQLDGGLSRRLEALRTDLVDLQALLSYEVDFPEEDDGPVAPERIRTAAARVRQEIAGLLRTAPAGQRVREGAVIVIAGRPNAGKSSLFNALLGTDRVLVSATPGTTRDAVESDTDFGGWPVRLVDTAGLAEFSEEVDRLGVAMSHRFLGGADLVLLCVESGREVDQAEQALLRQGALLLRTKTDLRPAPSGELGVSVVTREGLDRVREHCVDRLFAEPRHYLDLEPVLTRERHRVGLERAAGALQAAMDQLPPQGDAVLATHHIREATEHLTALIGTVDIDEILDRLFSSFCVGK